MQHTETGAALAPDVALAMLMRKELLRLAMVEDNLAAEEAARTPYWAACPPSVAGHRAAAEALRADAERFLVRNDLLRAAS